MENYKGLPFATYDLAVYLPGGAVLLLVLQYAFTTVIGDPLAPDVSLFSEGVVRSAVEVVVWLSASYLVGHLGAFLSTYVIERFTHNALGYPSDVWLEREEHASEGVESSKFLKHLFKRNIQAFKWSFPARVVFVALFPIWIWFLLFRLFLPVGFYMPKLPERLLPDIQDAYGKIGSRVPLEYGSRWEKLVEHYVANSCPLAYQRMYNYLVIYGALRLLAFILLVCCWVILAKSALVLCDGSDWTFSLRRIALFCAFSISAYLAMLAFAKFNRRYFEETILALLLSPNVGRFSPENKTARARWANRYGHLHH